MHNQIITVVINNEKTLMELTEEQEVTLEEHLARYRQSRPEHTARIEELEAKLKLLKARYRQLTLVQTERIEEIESYLEFLQTEYRKLRPEHRAEEGPEHEHILRALKLEKALREKARDNPNFVHSIELFPIDFLRWSIWSATAEVSPALRTWNQSGPPNLVNKYPESDKQVDTADKNQLFCPEECRTRNPINLDLFDTFNLENA